MKYLFENIESCEMCGNPTSDNLILGQRLNKTQGMRPKKKFGISVSIIKCRKCDLIYAQPMPIPFNMSDHYGIPPESYWSPSYFAWHDDYFAIQIKHIKELLLTVEGLPRLKALDIGAGIGKAMISLENAGFDAFGFEASKPFYDKAIANMNIPIERIKLCSIEDANYDENSFDVISFGAVFEHLYHPAENLKKALGWLKPGGIIHIEVPSSNHFIAKLLNTYYRLTGSNYVTNLSPMHSPFHLYEFGLQSFIELGRKLNFNIEKYYYDVCTISHLPKILHPIVRKYMEKSNTGMQLTVFLRKKI